MENLLLGLSQGATIAMAAVGFTLIWKVSGVVNLSLGAYFVGGGLLSWAFDSEIGLPLLTSVSLAVVIGSLVAFVLQMRVITVLTQRPIFYNIVLTYALGLGMTGLLGVILSADYRSIPTFMSTLYFLQGSFTLSLLVPLSIALAIFATVAVVLLSERTAFGLMARAVSADKTLATLTGVKSSKVVAITAALAAGMATLGGSVYAMSSPLSSGSFQQITLYIASSAIIGGLGSLWRSFFVAIGLVALGSTLSLLAPTGLIDIVILVLMVLVLSRRYDIWPRKHIWSRW